MRGGDHDATRKYKKKICTETFQFFDIDKILIPVVDSYHYTLYVVYMDTQDIVFFDTLSMTTPRALRWDDILSYLEDEAKLIQRPFFRNEWNCLRARVINQGNSVDCGFCIIKYGLLVLQDLPLDLPVCCINVILINLKK